jgi:Zn-dependent protease with chaperone function
MNSSPSPPPSRVLRYRYVLRPVLHSPAVLYGILLAAVIGAAISGLRGMVLSVCVWLSASVLMLWRPGERLAVRGLFRWKPLDVDAAFGTGVGNELRRVIGADFQRYDWYIEKSGGLNAMAVGGHAIAITSRMLELHHRRRLADEHVIAVVLHEYGHHCGGIVRFGAALTWLILPWSFTRNLTRAFMHSFAGPKPKTRGKIIAAAVLVTAALDLLPLLGRHVGLATLVAAAVILLLVVVPLLEAHLMRAEELRADQIAADLGYGRSLRAVFDARQDTTPSRLHWYKRSTAHHPPFTQRSALLRAHNTLLG